jgi:hypothetical protein
VRRSGKLRFAHAQAAARDFGRHPDVDGLVAADLVPHALRQQMPNRVARAAEVARRGLPDGAAEDRAQHRRQDALGDRAVGGVAGVVRRHEVHLIVENRFHQPADVFRRHALMAGVEYRAGSGSGVAGGFEQRAQRMGPAR